MNQTLPLRRYLSRPGCLSWFGALALALAAGFWPVGVLRGESVVIGCVGDFGGAVEGSDKLAAALAVAELIKRWDPQFVFTTGDNNYPDGGADDIDFNVGQFYHEYIHPYGGAYGAGALSNRFFPCLGNHDVLTSNGAPYLDYFALPGNERYYRYRSGPVELFAVNSNPDVDGGTATSVQGRWLQAQLTNSTARWKLVYFHHPPYSAALGGAGNPGMRWPFTAWGATAVLTGHEHSYARIFTNNIYYFVNGLGGEDRESGGQSGGPVQVRYNADYGAMRLEATETNLIFHFVTRNDVIIDTLVLGDPMGSPFLLASPVSQEVVAGSTVNFRVQAAGPEPLRYQWLSNQVELLNATNRTFQILNAQLWHEAEYSARVTGGSSNASSVVSRPATLTILRHPLITRQPVSQKTSGQPVTLTVAALGAGTLRYQWFFNSREIAGATSASLVLTNVLLPAMGDYQVRVTDNMGSVLSQIAHLTVLARPVIGFHPLGQSAPVGGTVTFSISAIGTLPMNYSWRLNGRILTNIMLNQSTCFWTLRDLQLTNAGPYTVGITNLAGPSSTGLSRPALLTVLADADADGMPDEWELAHGFRPEDPADAALDLDGDGQSNLSEYRAGTDPATAESCLRLERTVRGADGSFQFEFAAASNRTYAVEARTSPDGAWEPLLTFPAAASNRVVTVLDPGASAPSQPRLFRVLTPQLR